MLPCSMFEDTSSTCCKIRAAYAGLLVMPDCRCLTHRPDLSTSLASQTADDNLELGARLSSRTLIIISHTSFSVFGNLDAFCSLISRH